MSKRVRYRGLSNKEVLASRARHGANVLTPPQKESWLKLFFSKFNDPLIVILMVIGVFAVGVSCYEYWGLKEDYSVFFEPIGIFVAILLATGLGFYFELKAQKEFTILNKENDQERVVVIRNGNATEIPKCDVVVGDILVLQTGQEIPADARLLSAVSLIVDESSLTGEPAHQKGLDVDDDSTTYPRDLVYRGTQVMEGHGYAEVTAVGDRTENGRIMQSLLGVEIGDDGDEAALKDLNKTQRLALRLNERNKVTRKVRTPLNEQLDRLGRLITYASYAVAGIIVVGRLLVYFHWHLPSVASQEEMVHFLAYLLNTIMIAVTLVVVAVPEGLPMAVSLSLANSMRKMLKTNNLVRKMHACETMGAATVICTDKTGTLTMNQMQVRESAVDMTDILCEGIALNSTASLDFTTSNPKVIGNPTEGALLLWILTHGHDYRDYRAEAERIQELPFSPDNKYMATLVRSAVMPGKTLLYIKGAPEIVMGMCETMAEGHTKDEFEQTLRGYQEKAMRTLGFACQVVDDGMTVIRDGKIVADNLTFMGVVGIEDPVRDDVKEAVEQCLNAGIDIKIVTGDTMETAREIGRQIGVWKDDYDDRNIIDGRTFAALSWDELLRRVNDLKIIARARPMDKKRLVEALQERGHVVAVTGDGTNDAPALNAAHVGLSMGDGTSVAKEASDITIIDNSFASIVRAVKWGRSLFQNIQRFLLFQLTVNVAACLLVLWGAFLDTTSPLTVTQMLWVNLIMDTFAAFALSGLPPTDKVMTEKPRNRKAFILDREMRMNILGVGVFFFFLLLGLLYICHYADVNQLSDLLNIKWTVDPKKFIVEPKEQTLIFTIFVMTHFWYLFNARAYNTGGSGFDLKGCDSFITIAVIILVGQIMITQLPVFNKFFNVVRLEWTDLAIIIVLSALVVGVRELHAFMKRASHR